MINNSRISVVISAGGNGSRFDKNKKKQYFELFNKTILEWTVLAFYNHKDIDQIILVVPAEDIVVLNGEFSAYMDKLHLCTGSNTRQKSVFNGLNACPRSTEIVLIHDGVRPFISHKEISDLIDLSKAYQAVIPVTKAKYTIKEFTENSIVKTLDREKLVEVHTPQIFNYQHILEFHKQAVRDELEFTDDAGILEYYQQAVKIYFCSYNNIKITNPADLILAEAILKNMIEEGNYEI